MERNNMENDDLCNVILEVIYRYFRIYDEQGAPIGMDEIRFNPDLFIRTVDWILSETPGQAAPKYNIVCKTIKQSYLSKNKKTGFAGVKGYCPPDTEVPISLFPVQCLWVYHNCVNEPDQEWFGILMIELPESRYHSPAEKSFNARFQEAFTVHTGIDAFHNYTFGAMDPVMNKKFADEVTKLINEECERHSQVLVFSSSDTYSRKDLKTEYVEELRKYILERGRTK